MTFDAMGTSVRLLARDAAVGLILVAGLWLTMPAPSPSARIAQGVLVAVVLLGLLACRRAPRTAAMVVGVATAIGWALGVTGDPFLAAGLCLLVVAERHGTQRFPGWSVAIGVLLLLSTLVVSSAGLEDRFRGMLVGAVVLGAAWMLGVRTRQGREQAAQRVRDEERLRLSRDVHDVLSHTVGTIGVRAGVLAHVGSATAEQMREVLHEIEGDSRAALGELRTLLDGQRNDPADVPAGADLEVLLQDTARAVERAGVMVHLSVDAEAERAPVSVRTTAHRVVQEALTNVVRHARATSSEVCVETVGEVLSIRVRDDGRGAQGTLREGHGLTGMRERVALVGGTLELGRDEGVGADGEGFVVRAELPLQQGPGVGAGGRRP